MRKIFFFSLLFVLAYSKSNAQFLQDQNGTAYVVKPYSNITGSPFLFADWTNGIVKLRNGNTYDKVGLKYNIHEEILVFKSNKGEQLEFVQPVEEFAFYNSDGSKRIFKNLSTYKQAKKGNAYFEVLYDGGVPLYKKVNKDILETREYGSSVLLKRFEDIIGYYTRKDGNIIPVKKLDERLLASLFNGKTNQIKDYLEKNTISTKDERSLIALFSYLNSN